MILGVAIDGDRMLLAVRRDDTPDTELLEFTLSTMPDVRADFAGSLWSQAGEAASELYREAEELIVVIPMRFCYSKNIRVAKQLQEQLPDYLSWRAGMLVPGQLNDYHYGFLPLEENEEETVANYFFYAVPRHALNTVLDGLVEENDGCKVIMLPEALGLVKVLEKSIGQEEIPQASLVNCEDGGATAVFVKNNRFHHCKYLVSSSGTYEDLSLDIETYLLSQAEASESLPLVLTGKSENFKTNWSPIVPPFLKSDPVFCAVWGAVEFVIGAKSENRRRQSQRVSD